MAVAEQRIDSAGIELRVLVPAGTPTALIVHGIASDADAWAQRAAALGAIVYDRRGYGGSQAPEPYVGTTVEEQAEDAARLLAALDAPPLIVAGDGLGALVALDLARRHRARVRALALGDPVLLALLPDGAEWLANARADLEATLRAGGHPLLAPFADLAALGSWSVTRRELRTLELPIAITTRADAAPHVAASAEGLSALLPAAQRLGHGDLSVAVRAL